jgi:hypothetical protein
MSFKNYTQIPCLFDDLGYPMTLSRVQYYDGLDAQDHTKEVEVW